METEELDIKHDLLLGADAIGALLGLTRRQVYHANSRSYFPTFKIGSVLCARRTTLVAWFLSLEAAKTVSSTVEEAE